MSNTNGNYGLSTLRRSFLSYYKTINGMYLKHFNKYLMLHYPFYLDENESLEKRQRNLIDHCLGSLSSIHGKALLDIGSGNGALSVYLYDNYNLTKVTGIDINEDNLNIAEQIKGDRNIEFVKDDAELMAAIPDNTIEIAICIESAFHYENKDAFLRQLKRVLKGNGEFIIADIVNKSHKKRILLGRWKRKMRYFHWTENDYIQGLRNAGFTNFNIEDITKKIINGYAGYQNWGKDIQTMGIVSKFMFHLVMFVQVQLNVFLLKRRRKYLIIRGC